MTPVVGGWDTLLWRVDAADGRRFALRVFRPDQVMTCQREVAVMRALAEQPVPVPSVAAFGSSDNRSRDLDVGVRRAANPADACGQTVAGLDSRNGAGANPRPHPQRAG
jgi:aminoglycoside phosphotransferase (APT) family kinase protein